MLDSFIQGILLGFAVAAPVGPIGILCIRRALQSGRLSALISGLGAALADTIYAIIAAFGLTFLLDLLTKHQNRLQLIGGLFMLCLGVKIFLSKPTKEINLPSSKSLTSDFFSTFLLTLTSPVTILFFIAAFASLNLHPKDNYREALFLVIGVFTGSFAWWIILSEGVTLFRRRVNHNNMLWVNRIAGMIVITFGLVILINLGLYLVKHNLAL